MGRIVLGAVISFIGFLFVWKTQAIFMTIGRIDWAEEHLGSGGTRSFLKYFGLLAILVGFSVITNLSSDILSSFAGLFAR